MINSSLSSTRDYQTFLQGKRQLAHTVGIEVALSALHPTLFPFQRTLVQWALRKGRAALFADCGLGKCVVAGTMIPTEDGLLPIEQLQPQGSDLGSTPLQVQVQTPDGPSPTSHFYSSGQNPTLRVTTHMGFQVAGTYVHPLLVLDHDGRVKWRQLQEILVGDYVAVQRHGAIFGHTTQLPAFDYVREGNYGADEKALAVSVLMANDGILTQAVLDNIRTQLGRNVSDGMVRQWSQRNGDYTAGNVTMPALPTHLSEDLAYALGVFVGDGCLRTPTTVLLCNPDEEIVTRIRDWATSLNLTFIQKDHLNYEIHSVVLKRWLFNLGLSEGLAHVKVVPHTILTAPKDHVRAFLQGLFDTDGSALKCGGVEFCSASETLARQIHLLLLQFGIVSRLRFKANTKRGAWIVQMYGAEARKFYERVGFRLTRKQARVSLLPAKSNTNLDVIPHLPDVKWHDKRRGFRNYQVGVDCPSYAKLRTMAEVYPELSTLLEPEYFWDRVEEVADNGIVSTYDLTVPGSHAFVANGIVSHNTFMQLSWASQVHQHTGGDLLILAPLAVAGQTISEGAKLGIPVHHCRKQSDVCPGLNISNYEMLEHFDPSHFIGVVCDESSILKSYMGRTKRALVESFAHTPYRLCCTATPAPNDHMEIGNHSEFLGIMPSNEMMMRWFINDTMKSGHYRLKGHAVKDFWDWVTSWAVSIRKPSDLGFSDDGFVLPELQIQHHYVEADVTVGTEEGQLFRAPTMSATSLHREMRLTVVDRAQAVASLVNESSEVWTVWCHTNYEADELVKRIPDAVEVRGNEKAEVKERKLMAFTRGESRVIITKPSIAGYGLNWQHCHNAAFVGLSYSYEDFYQAVRRLYRFGQTDPVQVHVIAADTEGTLVTTLERKMRAHMQMTHAMNASALSEASNLQLSTYHPQIPMILPTWLVSQQKDQGAA